MNYTLVQAMPPSVERIDMAGVKYRLQQVPEEFIMQLVRNRPELKWLRCDISDQGRLQLMKERSDITIVNW